MRGLFRLTPAERTSGLRRPVASHMGHCGARDWSCRVRDALIAFMAATAQAQAEATKAAQRAGIEHAKQHSERAYLGRKPSYTRQQFGRAALLAQEAVGIARIAKETGLTRQTIYRIKDDPASAEAALAACSACRGMAPENFKRATK
jgi:DNA invertase Pin-like site-specific DNA recombinase